MRIGLGAALVSSLCFVGGCGWLLGVESRSDGPPDAGADGADAASSDGSLDDGSDQDASGPSDGGSLADADAGASIDSSSPGDAAADASGANDGGSAADADASGPHDSGPPADAPTATWLPDQQVYDGTAYLISHGPSAMASNLGESILLSCDPNSHQLFQDTYANGSFSGRVNVGTMTSTLTPGMTAYKSSFLIAFLTDDNSGNLLWAQRDVGFAWGSASPLVASGADGGTVPILASDAPALATFNNQVVLAFRWGTTLRYALGDGTHWAPDLPIAGTNALGRPALAVYGNALYLAFRHDADSSVEIRTFDGSTWSTGSLVPGVSTPDDVSIAAHRGTLYLLHLANAANGIDWTTFDGANWSADQSVHNQSSAWSPHVADLGGQLVMLHTAGNDLTVIYDSIWAD
jgi:hypothetical protein